MKTIDNIICGVVESLTEMGGKHTDDPAKGALPLNSEARTICFNKGKKTFKLVIWDISAQKK